MILKLIVTAISDIVRSNFNKKSLFMLMKPSQLLQMHYVRRTIIKLATVIP